MGPPSEPEQDAVSATTRLQGQAQVVVPEVWARVTALPGRVRRQSPLPEIPSWVRLWGEGDTQVGNRNDSFQPTILFPDDISLKQHLAFPQGLLLPQPPPWISEPFCP